MSGAGGEGAGWAVCRLTGKQRLHGHSPVPTRFCLQTWDTSIFRLSAALHSPERLACLVRCRVGVEFDAPAVTSPGFAEDIYSRFQMQASLIENQLWAGQVPDVERRGSVVLS